MLYRNYFFSAGFAGFSIAFPLSMLVAFDLMARAGIAGSLMSLGAIDFGLIVDSSVIMVENCVRHVSHRRDKPWMDTIRDAALEVRKPTMFGELIIMIVFLPILTLEGIEGKLFRPMALTMIFALCGSLILSLTLMPVLASLMLPARVAETEPWLMRHAQRAYTPILAWALRFRTRALVGAAVIVTLAALGATRIGGEFLPKLKEGAQVVNVIRLAGISIEEAAEYNTRIEQLILELRVLVVLRADGTVAELRVLQSSGNRVLDDAALRIGRLSAPFDPLPAALRARGDVLEIIRTWQFRADRLATH